MCLLHYALLISEFLSYYFVITVCVSGDLLYSQPECLCMLYSQDCMALCVNTQVVDFVNYDSVLIAPLVYCLRMYLSINSVILCHICMSVNVRLQHISNYVYKCYISMFTRRL